MLLNDSYIDVFPVEDILVKSVDINNIMYAHNFISSYINNQIVFGNNLNPYNILWNKAFNLVDETLKKVITGVNNNKPNRIIREEKFDYILNSELISIISLSTEIEELKEKIGKIIVGTHKDGTPVTIKDLKIEEAITLLLRDTLKPNLFQTRNAEPVFLYISPESNILPGGEYIDNENCFKPGRICYSQT